jgi:hypothetical protein
MTVLNEQEQVRLAKIHKDTQVQTCFSATSEHILF